MPQRGSISPSNSEHVQVVVVGSGFGGSVTAYRMAEAGRSVVVLERGKPYAPGDFARTPAATARAFWDPSRGLHGLFDLWTFRGLEAVVSSGLGGGSLIYANVLLRKDERWFVHESPIPGGGYENWPVSRQDLDPHYDRVERMLGATPYPYTDTPKARALQEAADRLRLSWTTPPLAVTFAAAAGEPPVPGAPIPLAPYGNLHGRPRRTCRLLGECDVGCNEGAKNTLDHTYLSAAVHHGADIRTRCEVRGFAPLAEGGYEVRYVEHDPAAEGRPTRTGRLPERRITCDRLVLGAGTFGSTYLMLRNQAAFPALSRAALGTRFSGNGDLLTFLMSAHTPQGRHRAIEGSNGPVITTAIRVGDELDGDGSTGRGYYVEDAGYPAFVDWLVEATQLPGTARRAGLFAAHRLLARLSRSPKTGISADVSALIGRSELSDGSLPLLGMGRDVPDGVMRLRRGRLDVDWTTRTSAAYFARVRQTMQDLAAELHARYEDNPLWWRKRVISVHPLGGLPIGRHDGEGVCDPYGEVFGHPGLHVLDGSAVPGPVGANPSLTIAALADRACDRILAEPVPVHRPLPMRETAAPADHRAVVNADATSLAFTEEMKGWFALGVTDPVAGRDRGRFEDDRLMFHLTITVDDVDAFVADSRHEAGAEGWVDADMLGGRLPVQAGWFNLFTRDGDPTSRRMLYRLHFADAAGNPLTLTGHKDVHDDPGLDVWSDTSTLYVRILGGHVGPGAQGTVVGAGVLTIHPDDFVVQLGTFRSHGPHRARAFERFGRLFLGELWGVYGRHLPGSEVPV